MSAQNSTGQSGELKMNNLRIEYQPVASVSKVQQLAESIKQAIVQGHYTVGEALPSVNQLSTAFNISRDTVFKAYKELKNRGIIESTPTKGYYVDNCTSQVFMFLDAYSPFKDELYNSFINHLPENYKVDLAFHHYNLRMFDTMIRESVGKYNMYVVMNFNNERISESLRRIDPNKLLILDWGPYKDENYSYVCQDFGQAAYHCFKQAAPLFAKYQRLNYVSPPSCVHPVSTYQYFERFCLETKQDYTLLKILNDQVVKPKNAYLVFQQKDIVTLLKTCKKKDLTIGRDVGVLAYNDVPLYEVIGNGITSISTDFTRMGQRAADFVINRQAIQEIIPTTLHQRASL